MKEEKELSCMWSAKVPLSDLDMVLGSTHIVNSSKALAPRLQVFEK